MGVCGCSTHGLGEAGPHVYVPGLRTLLSDLWSLHAFAQVREPLSPPHLATRSSAVLLALLISCCYCLEDFSDSTGPWILRKLSLRVFCLQVLTSFSTLEESQC